MLGFSFSGLMRHQGSVALGVLLACGLGCGGGPKSPTEVAQRDTCGTLSLSGSRAGQGRMSTLGVEGHREPHGSPTIFDSVADVLEDARSLAARFASAGQALTLYRVAPGPVAIAYASEGYADLTGFSLEELVGMTFYGRRLRAQRGCCPVDRVPTAQCCATTVHG